MTEESKRDQAGEDKAAANQEGAAKDSGAGELSIEELAKVAGGLVTETSSFIGAGSMNQRFVAPKRTNP